MWGNKKKKKSILIVGGFDEARSLANSLLEKDYRVTVVNKNYEDCEKLAELNKLNVIYGDGSKKFILEDAFYQMGIDRVVCALNMITNIMEENALMDEMMKMIPLEEGRLHIAETAILHNSALIGKKLWELNLPTEIITGCILRGDQSLIPRGDTSVKEGDVLLMITSDKEKLNTIKELTIS